MMNRILLASTIFLSLIFINFYKRKLSNKKSFYKSPELNEKNKSKRLIF